MKSALITSCILLAPATVRPESVTVSYFAAGAVIVAVIVVFAALRQRRKRREDLAQLGRETGFVYADKPDVALAAELSEVRLASVIAESQPRYKNVLRGTRGGDAVIIADRTVGSGKSSSTTTVIAFKLATPLTGFMLCHENVLWRLAERLGYTDIDMDGAPEFSRRYFLHGNEESAVRMLFTPDVIHTFEQLPADAHLTVNTWGRWLIISRPGRTIPVNEIPAFLQQAEVIANAFRRAAGKSNFGH